MSPEVRRRRISTESFLLFAFIGLALAIRIIFWIYTDRIWEDALITLNPAINLWEGHGLTHHVPEPRVYSFTSAISIMVLIVGEGLNHPIAFDRVLSLVSAAYGLFFAAKILQRFGVGTLGQAVCLSFLATDHLQIFFGMAGMETQIAIGIALGVVYAITYDRRLLFGVLAGLAALTRPEFYLLDAVFGIYAITRWKFRAIVPLIIAAVIFLPWIAFTWAYYGSPIPNTITVKRGSAGDPSPGMILRYALHYWRQFAPFWEFWFVKRVPGPVGFPGLVVGVAAVSALLGVAHAAMSRFKPLLLTAVVIAGFCAYMIRFNVNPYFMWYTAPFFALFFLLVALGVDLAASKSKYLAYALSTVLIVGYAIHLPFTLPLDRETQYDIEFAVRDEVGLRLAKLMGPNDSVFLEPLGYIGLRIIDRQIFDTPGLGSKIAAAAIQKHGIGAIALLKPTFVVVRPDEIALIDKRNYGLLDGYEEVDHVTGRTGTEISYGGLVYGSRDNEFFILRHKPDQN